MRIIEDPLTAEALEVAVDVGFTEIEEVGRTEVRAWSSDRLHGIRITLDSDDGARLFAMKSDGSVIEAISGTRGLPLDDAEDLAMTLAQYRVDDVMIIASAVPVDVVGEPELVCFDLKSDQVDNFGAPYHLNMFQIRLKVDGIELARPVRLVIDVNRIPTFAEGDHDLLMTAVAKRIGVDCEELIGWFAGDMTWMTPIRRTLNLIYGARSAVVAKAA
jgi:hypothetical protein